MSFEKERLIPMHYMHSRNALKIVYTDTDESGQGNKVGYAINSEIFQNP